VDKYCGFYAYPSNPTQIGETIDIALKNLPAGTKAPKIQSWKALDIFGHFISGEVLSGIEQSDFLIADISILNYNVTYEVGYAIGKQKRVLITKNKSVVEDIPSVREVGIFDTLGYREYVNSLELIDFINTIHTLKPLDISMPINTKAPVYLLDFRYKTDWATRIVSRIKKARYIFRAFDPNETPRLSAYDAISQVSQSYGVVVPILSTETVDHQIHNLRGAFIAGLAAGMGKSLCLMQNGDDPGPLDYRDFIKVTYHLDDVDECIADFASLVAEAFQQGIGQKKEASRTFLQSLDLGASSAENEMRTLENYYLSTDQFLKSLRGDAHIVVGRKGSGKSAIFLQIRDIERDKNRSKNIVLDLKPEGYKLVKFKEMILSFLQEGTYQHMIMAFWEYVLLLEVAYKLLEKDQQRHIHNHLLYEPYRKLSDLYYVEGYDTQGDFSERMTGLMENIQSEYHAKYSDTRNKRLSASQVTELLYIHDIRKLEHKVVKYMQQKGILWLLFDNIDKGWPASGLERDDLIIIRALIEATRKIERNFKKSGDVEVHSIVFLRNDVYELLVRETSDRGKEAKVLLDWTDPDLLRELIRLRIVTNNLDSETDFQSAWLRLCVSHYKGEETSQYLIDRSLMRPRFLIDLINQCKSYAINLNHSIVEEEDIIKGLSAYSTDLLTDIGYEINDIFPKAKDVLYAFISSAPSISKEKIYELLREFEVIEEDADSVFKLLLWHGFFGVNLGEEETKYIYDFNYNHKLLEGVIKRNRSLVTFSIHPAFWPALIINT